MDNHFKISCMIPCYNEEECITGTVEELVKGFQKLGYPYELVVIDHASRDKTLEMLQKLQEKHSSVKVIKMSQNIGYGGIINLGLREFTKGSIIGWTCADGEVKAEDTVQLVDFLIQNTDYAAVKASRINRNQGYRKFISGKYNHLVNALFRIKTTDINGWPLFVRSEVYDGLNIGLKNWVINIEILHKLQKKNLKFKDIDCVYQGRKGGRSKVNMLTIFAFIYQVILYKIQVLISKNKE
ncbi:TPA: glycosyltransferase family 2 protein [Candidatus Woesearchaeota archaeon]|nr:glycosyltransferase family 2 protein [Candidatus Woesearchaeota archaeon]